MSRSRADAPEFTDATHSAAPRDPICLDEAFDDPAAVLAMVPRQQIAKRMAILGREHPDHLIRSMRDLYYAGGFNASDAREGVRAFVEKRKPRLSRQIGLAGEPRRRRRTFRSGVIPPTTRQRGFPGPAGMILVPRAEMGSHESMNCSPGMTRPRALERRSTDGFATIRLDARLPGATLRAAALRAAALRAAAPNTVDADCVAVTAAIA